MTSEPLATENELDILKLFRVLWNGKLWIVGSAILFAGLALIYSYLVKQEWVSVAIMTKPSITALGPFYEERQLLAAANGNVISVNNAKIENDVYQEFLQQLGSYDTRRDFWLQSDYYTQRTEGDAKADAALLYEFVDNINLTLSSQKAPADMIQLTAETGPDAHLLLNQYIKFAADKTVADLNKQLSALHREQLKQLTLRLQQLDASAQADYQRNLASLQQLLASKTGQTAVKSSAKDDFSDEELKREIDNLTVNGPQFAEDYYLTQVLVKQLSEPLKLENFQPYRFLRTPDEPVKRSKPRRLFLLILWGAIGGFCGTGVALTRRKKLKVSYN
jgi:lipopolysaccharide biosynthesis protein WzzE